MSRKIFTCKERIPPCLQKFRGGQLPGFPVSGCGPEWDQAIWDQWRTQKILMGGVPFSVFIRLKFTKIIFVVPSSKVVHLLLLCLTCSFQNYCASHFLKILAYCCTWAPVGIVPIFYRFRQSRRHGESFVGPNKASSPSKKNYKTAEVGGFFINPYSVP